MSKTYIPVLFTHFSVFKPEMVTPSDLSEHIRNSGDILLFKYQVPDVTASKLYLSCLWVSKFPVFNIA